MSRLVWTWRLGLGRWPSCSTHLLGQLDRQPCVRDLASCDSHLTLLCPAQLQRLCSPLALGIHTEASVDSVCVYSLTPRPESVAEIWV